MNFKRGIFLGLMIGIGSISVIYGMREIENKIVLLPYLFALFLGIIQFIVSFSYQKLSKIRILLFCFCVEAIYYVIAIIYLLVNHITLEIKIFGTIVGSIMLSLICTSIYTIFNKFNKMKK